MKKQIFFALFLLLIPNFLLAQTLNQDNSVYLDSVDVKEEKVLQGEQISGSFSIRNGSNKAINDIYYIVSLVGDYKNDLPTKFYDSVKSSDAFDLQSVEVKTIPFSYDIPQNISGTQMGIEVEVFSDTGLSLGWNRDFIDISGQNKFLDVNSALIVKGEKEYTLDFGPTFLENETPAISIISQNISNAELKVYPRAVFFEYEKDYFNILEEKYEEKIFKIGEKKEIQISLPKFNKKAGVYLGDLYLEDEKGQLLGPKISFQYILDGDIATIHGIDFDKTEFKKGDAVQMFVSISGKPFAEELVDTKNVFEDYQLLIDVYNEKGEKSYSYDEMIQSSDNYYETVINFSSLVDIEYPIVKAKVVKNGKVINEFNSEVPDWVNLFNENDGKDNNVTTLYSILLSLILLFIIILMIKRENKFIVFILAILIVLSLSLLFMKDFKALKLFAQVNPVSFAKSLINNGNCTNTQGGYQGCGRVGSVWNLRPYVTINNPTSIGSDGKFNVTGSMVFPSCTNSPNSRHIYLINKNGSLTALNNQDQSGLIAEGYDSRGHWFTGTKRFSVPVSLEKACGVHQIDLRFVNCVAGECGFNDYRLDIDLGPCDQCVNLPGDQLTVPGGYTVDANKICTLTNEFQAICSPEENPIAPGSTANFKASVFNSVGDVEFKWYQGRQVNDSPIQTDINRSQSRLLKKYDQEGVYQVTVAVKDGNGSTFSRTCGVVVRDPNDDGDEKIDTDGDGIPDTSLLDLYGGRGGPAADLGIDIDKILTNDTCTVSWDAKNVTQCFLLSNVGSGEPVSFSGTKTVSPGSYWLRCLATRDGKAVESEKVTCRLNPDIREI